MLEKIVIHNMMALDKCMDGVDTALKALHAQHKINKRSNALFWFMAVAMFSNQMVLMLQDKQIRELTNEVKELKTMKEE